MSELAELDVFLGETPPVCCHLLERGEMVARVPWEGGEVRFYATPSDLRALAGRLTCAIDDEESIRGLIDDGGPDETVEQLRERDAVLELQERRTADLRRRIREDIEAVVARSGESSAR